MLTERSTKYKRADFVESQQELLLIHPSVTRNFRGKSFETMNASQAAYAWPLYSFKWYSTQAGVKSMPQVITMPVTSFS